MVFPYVYIYTYVYDSKRVSLPHPWDEDLFFKEFSIMVSMLEKSPETNLLCKVQLQKMLWFQPPLCLAAIWGMVIPPLVEESLS